MKFLKPMLRIILLYCFFTFFTQQNFAQTSKIEKLSQLLSTEKKDSSRVTLLWQLAEQYQAFKPDTSLQLAQEALLLAQRINFTEGESHSLALLATSQYLLGNYPKALDNYMLRLKIEEKRNSPRNYASALNNIGLTYILLEDYTNAREYLYRADSIVNVTGGKTKEELKYKIEVNIGEAYYRMKIPDSASKFFNSALTVANFSGDSAAIGAAILGNANVWALRNEPQKALRFYWDAYGYLKEGSDADILCEVSLGIAKIYERLARNDSAIHFGMMSYSLAEKSKFLSRQLDADLFLSGIYNNSKKYDMAFSYLKNAMLLKDSIMGHEKIKAAMILSLNEKLRQQEITEQKLRDEKARSQQIQRSIIAVFIPILFLITVFISRIKVHKRHITFMGIVSLLFLFEFLTLLLTPIVGSFTNHLPVLELLIFVGIAALLAPAHHKLEHVLINNLTKRHKGADDIRIKTVKIVSKKK